VIATRQGPVTLLTLNRPDRRNALTPAVQQRLDSLLRDADADPACRAIVITGAGRAFCAGADPAEAVRDSCDRMIQVFAGGDLWEALDARKASRPPRFAPLPRPDPDA
jgi:2-(1,2-epoxy-1,2-dihydrophenyl)acetyl-CoA isomerase